MESRVREGGSYIIQLSCHDFTSFTENLDPLHRSCPNYRKHRGSSNCRWFFQSTSALDLSYISVFSLKMAVLEPTKGTTFFLWKYIPSLAPSIAFAILYLLMTCLIGFRMYKTKTWFCSAFVIGGFSKPCRSPWCFFR